ncbi:uncharacterized protein N7482_006570 [Penicillium canariense]|uniref:Uncharacterized protein n=1 Tax=Penicillium canariense TaxID=189055 RepID=A0A9W9HXG0_9EURO|nr:uncharacterized protein N7482_006570 [Penicillium canariense]KAJ5159566.1 hypothetical protein N7482_006570 [Penicillium canariense]
MYAPKLTGFTARIACAQCRLALHRPPIGEGLNLPLRISPIDNRKSSSSVHADYSLRVRWAHFSNPVSVLLADPVLSFSVLESEQLQPDLRNKPPGLRWVNAAQLSAS